MVNDVSFGKTFRELSSKNKYFYIANYQRFLSWREREWEEFWETIELILSGNRKKVCLNLISTYKDPKEDHTELTEGQQRFTIITLLALACYKFLTKEEAAAKNRRDPDMDPEDETEEEILIQESKDLVKSLFILNKKPILRFFDNETNTIYSELVTSPINSTLTTQKVIEKYSDSIIIEEYLFLYNKLTTKNIHDVCNIINGFEDSGISVDYGLSFLRANCENRDECSDFFIFQDKGKKLEAVEIMHSHFINLTRNFFSDDKIKEGNYISFLHELRSNYSDINELSKLYQLFFYLKDKEHKQKTDLRYEFCSKKKFVKAVDFENFLNDLRNFYILYESIRNGEADDKLKPLNLYLRFDLDRGFFTWHIIIDLIRNKDDLSKEEIEKTLDICYSLLIRRKIAGQRGGSDNATVKLVETAVDESKKSNKPYIECLINVIKSKSRPGIFGYLDDNEFYNNFSSHDFFKDKEALKYILLRLNYHGKDYSEYEKFVTITAIKGFSIEHVMSQKGNQNSNKLNVIGNLTLVTGPTNSKLGAKPFLEKKEIYKLSSLYINEYFVNLDKWEEIDIDTRTNYLIELIKQAGFLNI